MKHRVLTALAIASGIALLFVARGQQHQTRLSQLALRVAHAEQHLARVEDYQHIANLQRQYGYYLDKAQFNELVNLFTDDVSVEYSQRGVYLGKERARKLMNMMPGGAQGLQFGQLQNHLQVGGVIHVAEDGLTAKGRWRALIMMGDTTRHWANWQEGLYENEYRKEGGVWKISRVRFLLNVNADYDKGWGVAPKPVPGPSRDNPPDLPQSDPAYQPYPTPYIPPYHYPNPVTGKPWSPRP